MMPLPLNLKAPYRAALAALSGVLYFLSFVGFEQWYLAWICLVPLLFALDGASPKAGLLLGWLFGTVALTGGFYWTAYTIRVFAFMPWTAAVAGCLLLSFAQATQFAAFGLAYAWLRTSSRRSPVILATALFVASEFVSPQLFPHYFGNSQYLRLHIIQIADIAGVLGVSLLLAFVNAAIFAITRNAIDRRFPWHTAAAVPAVLIAVVFYGHLRIGSVEALMEDAPKVRFGIAQANMGIYEKKRNPEKALRLNREMTQKLKTQGAEIVVWPETAVQAPVLDVYADSLPHSVVGDIGTPLIIGALQRNFSLPGSPLFNVAILSDAAGRIEGSYRKQKLLMFGEYIPMGESFPGLYKKFPYITRFRPGRSNDPIAFGDYLLSVNICYEGILPRLVRNMMKSGAHAIVNVTNDSWFGRTHEPMQHLALAAFRAVEHRRWLVRSTNTGISAFVDATGRIIERSPLMEPATLIRDVPMMEGKTAYATLGDFLGWLSLGAALSFAFSALKVAKRK
ncbi:MAG TPA: apolipoprotein N-acyltransferase [bacterium]|nr:apolipoprotein N-acyltransferase [bacterium]